MIVRFLGQSGYVLQSKHSKIIIDPYLSDSVERAYGRPRLLPIPCGFESIDCDAVVCTHDHLDHLDPDTVAFFPKEQRFLTTNQGKETLFSLGKNNVTTLAVGQSIQIGDFLITAVFAKHTVEAFGVVVRAEGKTLYFSGDTLFDEQLFSVKQYRPDVAFLCINGKLGNMNVQDALLVAEAIGAAINVPNHYDMFASNAENPFLFSLQTSGGQVLEFNVDYVVEDTKLTPCALLK